MRKTLRSSTLPLLVVFLIGCGDDAPPPPPPRDASADSQVPDAEVDDSGAQDGDTPSDAESGDASTEDTYDPEVPCESETFELAVDPMSRQRAVSAAATSRGFVFGWGDTAAVREQVRTAEVADGASEPIVRFLTDDDSSARAVRVAEGFAIWLDDGGTGENLVVRGSNTTSTEPPLRTLSADTGQHASPWLHQNGDGWVASWLRQEGEDDWRIQVRAFDNDGEQDTITLPWSVPSGRFAIAQADGRFYFAWTESGDVKLAVTDEAGAEVRAPETVSTQGNATTDEVSVAFGDGFGVVAFGVLIESVRYEVRVRLLDADGAPVRPEQVVSRAPLRGRQPEAAAYAGGYVIAYRASNVSEEEHVRVAFVHGSDGDVVAEYDLGEADFDGGMAGIAVDDEGGLGVGWANIERDASTIVRGSRLSCEGAWLRCGVMP